MGKAFQESKNDFLEWSVLQGGENKKKDDLCDHPLSGGKENLFMLVGCRHIFVRLLQFLNGNIVQIDFPRYSYPEKGGIFR